MRDASVCVCLLQSTLLYPLAQPVVHSRDRDAGGVRLRHVTSAASADDDRYAFWAISTATLARRTGRPRRQVSKRVVRCFRDVCEAVQPTVSLEIGAHEADYSRWARATFPDARVVALEANPYVHEQYRSAVRAAGVEYEHLAATDTTGTVTLKIPTEIHGRSRTRTNKMGSLNTHHASGGHEEVEVRASRIDDLVATGAGDRVVAWIDVEGAAGQVLEGARATLAHADAVFIEVESEPTWEGQWLDRDVARYFAELGKVPAVRDVEKPTQYNVLFLDHRVAARPEVARRVGRTLSPASSED